MLDSQDKRQLATARIFRGVRVGNGATSGASSRHQHIAEMDCSVPHTSGAYELTRRSSISAQLSGGRFITAGQPAITRGAVGQQAWCRPVAT